MNPPSNLDWKVAALATGLVGAPLGTVSIDQETTRLSLDYSLTAVSQTPSPRNIRPFGLPDATTSPRMYVQSEAELIRTAARHVRVLAFLHGDEEASAQSDRYVSELTGKHPPVPLKRRV